MSLAGLTVAAALVCCGPRAALAQRADPLAPLSREVAAAENALQSGERQIAESHFRSALLEGWMLAGAIGWIRIGLLEQRAAAAHSAIEEEHTP